MVGFADTSGLYALLDENDNNHSAGVTFWQSYHQQQTVLVTTNYILLECQALIQRRLGMEAVLDFQTRIVPMLSVDWITESIHKQGVAQMLTANRRQLSLVDCTSFVVMRHLGIDAAFAFDQHFAEQGFRVFPEGQ